MTIYGWVFMILSLTFVWGLMLWCYYKIFTAPNQD